MMNVLIAIVYIIGVLLAANVIRFLIASFVCMLRPTLIVNGVNVVRMTDEEIVQGLCNGDLPPRSHNILQDEYDKRDLGNKYRTYLSID